MEPERKGIICQICGVKFTRADNLKTHIRTVHTRATLVHTCLQCPAVFQNVIALQQHRMTHIRTDTFSLVKHAFRKNCKLYRKYARYEAGEPIKTLQQLFLQVNNDLKQLLNHEIGMMQKIKCAICIMVEMWKLSVEGRIEEVIILPLRTPNRELVNFQDVQEFTIFTLRVCDNFLTDFTNRGSRWQVGEILYLDVEIGNCIPLSGSCEKVQLDFPLQVKNVKEAKNIIEPPNCFLKAVASYFVKSVLTENLTEFINQNLKMGNLQLPMRVACIDKFEELNSHLSLKIHVLYSEETRIYPLRISKRSNAKHVIILLLYTVWQKQVGEEKCINHYSLVSNVNNFLRRYYNKKDGKKRGRSASVYCINCLNEFPHAAALKLHEDLCFKQKGQTVLAPVADGIQNYVSFKNFNNKYPLHFTVIADFESLLKSPRYSCKHCKKLNKDCTHKTLIDNNQQPFMYSLIIIDQHQNLRFHKTYIGKDCAENLLETLLNVEEELATELLIHHDINFKPEDFVKISEAEDCHICEQPLCIGEVAHRDHDHLNPSSNFLGMSHSTCNLNRRVDIKVPVYFHNFEFFDSHFIVKNLHTIRHKLKEQNFSVIASNTERFKKLHISIYDFLDSFAMLSSSLESLVENLKTDQSCEFKIMKQMPIWQQKKLDQKSLLPFLLQKGIYPYEYVTSIKKLTDKKIPRRKHFCSKLSNSGITKEEHKYAKFIFKQFKCKNMIDYSKLYCETDVYLLAEVLVNFRLEILRDFQLDMTRYISLPQLAFDCMLKQTKVKLELLTDLDQILMVESGLRVS
jgi:hypothetical protein